MFSWESERESVGTSVCTQREIDCYDCVGERSEGEINVKLLP